MKDEFVVDFGLFKGSVLPVAGSLCCYSYLKFVQQIATVGLLLGSLTAFPQSEVRQYSFTPVSHNIKAIVCYNATVFRETTAGVTLTWFSYSDHIKHLVGRARTKWKPPGQVCPKM